MVSEWRIVSGAENLLTMQPELAALAARCQQLGVLDFLDYFLHAPAPGFRLWFHSIADSKWMQALTRDSRHPHLLLRRGADGLQAAVLLQEYRVFGFSTGLYIPFDLDGYRTVIAPPEERSLVAGQAAHFLLQRGARLLLISHMEPSPGAGALAPPAPPEIWPLHLQQVPHLVAAQVRSASRMLPLQRTFDETLAMMGPRTRRNLRLAQRRVQNEMGAVHMPRAKLSLLEFLQLNRVSMYPVPHDVAVWRFQTAHTIEQGIFAGLRAADGRWLSLLGGHWAGDTVCLDWQMNLTGYASLSIGTAMRAFFIQHQIERGMQWIRFEGGTPHSISSAFAVEHARDLLFARSRVLIRVLRWLFSRIPAGGLLAKALASDAFVWRRPD